MKYEITENSLVSELDAWTVNKGLSGLPPDKTPAFQLCFWNSRIRDKTGLIDRRHNEVSVADSTADSTEIIN